MSCAKYSRKQSAPTWTRLLACSLRGYIYFLSRAFFGANNDPAVYRKEGVQIHKYLTNTEAIAGDMAFEFVGQWHRTFTTKQPTTLEAQEFNKSFVPIRLVVENVFGCLRLRWAALHNIWRHDKGLNEKVWYITSSIHNIEVNDGKELRSDTFFERYAALIK